MRQFLPGWAWTRTKGWGGAGAGGPPSLTLDIDRHVPRKLGIAVQAIVEVEQAGFNILRRRSLSSGHGCRPGSARLLGCSPLHAWAKQVLGSFPSN